MLSLNPVLLLSSPGVWPWKARAAEAAVGDLEPREVFRCRQRRLFLDDPEATGGTQNEKSPTGRLSFLDSRSRGHLLSRESQGRSIIVDKSIHNRQLVTAMPSRLRVLEPCVLRLQRKRNPEDRFFFFQIPVGTSCLKHNCNCFNDCLGEKTLAAPARFPSCALLEGAATKLVDSLQVH